MIEFMLGNALRAACGPLGDLHQKLAGPNGEEWFTALKRFLRKENPWAEAAGNFRVFKTIKLGTHKDVASLMDALRGNGFRITAWAYDILSNSAFTVAPEENEADLMVRSVAELGFEKGAKYWRICAAAQKLGLEHCPAEVGPQLRLQYPDQPYGESLIIAMEPITGSDGIRNVFRVDRGDGGRRLYTDYGSPDAFLRGESRFVFVRPRNP